MTPKMWIATTAFTLMIGGFVSRRTHRGRHIALMTTAMMIDLALVITLQLERDAIETALSFRLGALQQAHIAVSTVATALYFPLIALGLMKVGGRTPSSAVRLWHKRLGIAAFSFRSAGFVLMFSMLNKN